MDGQPPLESDSTKPAFGELDWMTLKVEPEGEIDPEYLHIRHIAETLFRETGIPTPTVQDTVVEVQAIGSGGDQDYKTAAGYPPLEVPLPGQSQDLHSAGPSSRVGEAPFPTTPQGLWPTLAHDENKLLLNPTYGAVYGQPYPDQAGTSQPQATMQRTPQKARRQTPVWAPYPLAAPPQEPQVYQQARFPGQAAGVPGPIIGNAAGAFPYIDLARVVNEAAGIDVGAAVGFPVPVLNQESGAKLICLQNPRDTHNDKERVRRARLRNAFAALRHLVPGLREDSDNASVSERVAEYTRHRNQTLSTTFGPEARKRIVREFLDKFQPS